MKNILVIFLFLLSANSWATGSFECQSHDSTFSMSAGVGHVPGAPLISDVTISNNGNTIVIPKGQVVGYWNIGRKFKIAIVDSNVMQIDYLLETIRVRDFKYWGSVVLPDGTIKGLSCVMN